MSHCPFQPCMAILVASLAALGACHGSGSAPQGPPGMPVKIDVARSVSVDDSSEYVATLKSRGSAAIMPQVEGHITKIFVRSGARVAAGAALMQIDPAKQQATVKSQEDTRAAKVAALQYARQQYDRVKAGIQNPGTLRTSQFIRARVVWGTRQGPVVPVLAVSRISGQYFAFVAEPEKGGLVARQRPLKVGEIVGNDYVVLDGIRAGDRVIVSGTQFLRDGAPVAPLG